MVLQSASYTYDDAIECLLNRYDWSHLIHQAHVHAIMDVLSSREGNKKGIRSLRDVLLQHCRALEAIDKDNFETLLMGIIEFKLDLTTMKDWQRASHEHKEMSPFEDLLDFLHLQARDTEKSMCDIVKNIL